MVASLDKIQSIRKERRIIGMVGVQDMGKLVWQNSAAYFTAFCLSVHAAPSHHLHLPNLSVLLIIAYNLSIYSLLLPILFVWIQSKQPG